MIGVSIVIAMGVKVVQQWQPFQVQFVRSGYGQTVQVCVDGVVKTTSARRMYIRDRGGEVRASFCANVRGPVSAGQVFKVHPCPSRLFGGTIQLAGNIVAKAFRHAQTPAQCAGLQLAIWEAIEDGGRQANFGSGSFQARGSAEAMNWAQTYYLAIEDDGDAVFLQQDSGGQSQIFV